MRRLFINFAAILSLLLLVATMALWVRSYMSDDAIEISRYVSADIESRTSLTAGSYDGTLGLSYHAAQAQAYTVPPVTYWRLDISHEKPSPMKHPLWLSTRGMESGRWFYWQGFVFHHGVYSNKPFLYYRNTDVGVPHWALAILCAIISLILVRRMKWSRPKPGRCPACNYDLTANVSGICPECGSKIAAK